MEIILTGLTAILGTALLGVFLAAAVRHGVCWLFGHNIDLDSNLFRGTSKTMCWRCARVVDRPAATPKGGA